MHYKPELMASIDETPTNEESKNSEALDSCHRFQF